MKKIILFLIGITLIFGSISAVIAEDAAQNFTVSADGTITAFNSDGVVVIPAEIDGTAVKKIGENAFFAGSITEVTVLANVQKIEKNAFSNCASLSRVNLYSDKIMLDEESFSGTSYIELHIYCTADKDAMKEKFALAKGEENFNIIVDHEKMKGETIKLGNSDVISEKCENCGFLKMHSASVGGYPFADVASQSWYAQYVDVAYNTGIINGKADDKFDPDATMTCGEAAKIAASIHSLTYGNTISMEKDEIDPWYVPYTNYCYKNGIFDDYINFSWNEPISRAQMAYVFSRADASTDYINEVPMTDIPDVHDTTPYGYEIIELYDKGIAVGDETMSFKPEDNIKRSEVAAIISRILFSDMRIELAKG